MSLQRFNLVMHGMVVCVESGNMVDVLLPSIIPHSYMHGEPQVLNGLWPLHEKDGFRIDGPVPGSTPLRELVSAFDTVVLDKAAIAVDSTHARNIYRVPRPDRVRMFRATEVNRGILRCLDVRSAVRTPRLLHHVLVFSYLNVPKAVTVSRTTPGAADVRVFNDPANFAESWCLYAQPNHVEDQHDLDGLNALFTYPDGKSAAFYASHEGTIDGRFNPASVLGLNETFSMNLLELSTQAGAMETGGGGGCPSVVVVE